MEGDFEKIRQKSRTLYIKSEFLNNDFVQAFLGGVEKLRERFDLKTIPASEFTRIYKFTISVEGVEREVYLKQYLRRPTYHFIKSVFRGSQARKTLKAEMMLAKNQINTPETLAIGEDGAWFFHTTSFSVTFGIEDSKPFFQFIRENRKHLSLKQPEIWREMIRAFGRTVGGMHANDIFHGDLRLNNVLVGREGGAWRFFFLDNERTRKFNKLPFRRRIQNLVQINMAPANVLGKTDRMRFFREYCAAAGTGKEKGKVLIAAILKKTGQRLDKRKKTHREPRKVLRTKTGQLWIETGNYRAMFSKGFPPFSEVQDRQSTETQDFIENLERLIRAGQIIKDERNCIISRIRWKGREMVVNQYVAEGFIQRLRQTIGKSRAKRDWTDAHQLRETAEPLAYIERLKSGLVWKSYFVTKYI